MRAPGQMAAAPTHDSGPVARRCDLDQDGPFAQALADQSQGGLRDAHASARALAVRLSLTVQVNAGGRLAQRLRRGVQAHRPSRAHESLSLDRTRVREDEQTSSLGSAALHGHVERVAPGETPLTQAIIPIVDDDDQTGCRARHPHGRARPHHDGKTSEGSSDVDAVALLRADLPTAHHRGHAQILLKLAGDASGVLPRRGHDNNGAARRHRRTHGLRQAGTHVGPQRRHDGARRRSVAQPR